MPEEKRIDVSNCTALISMRAIDRGSWSFSLKEHYVVKGATKPFVAIDIQKSLPDSADFDNLSIALDIDSSICVDEGSHVVLGIADGSKIVAQNHLVNNCHGGIWIIIRYRFDREHTAGNKDDLKKIREAKIGTIVLETHNGSLAYTLSDAESANLLDLINCIHKAK